ncbi:MAG TPA: ATP-binding protein [Woeseiaceae bacterium]|nr:ATP-binding protein [Woeseiaceae bacterium]
MRKLYLKIVAAIWIVMLGSSIGASLVVRALMPEQDRIAFWSHHLALHGIAERASALAGDAGEPELIAWFERHVPVRPGPPLSLLNSQGKLLAGQPLSPLERHALAAGGSDVPWPRGLHQIDFMHHGQRYRIVSRGPPHRQHAGHFAFFLLRPPMFWLSLAIAIVLSAILSFGIARYLVRPLRSIEQAARRLSDGDLSARVGPSLGNRGDEIADFAAAFDHMATRIESLVGTHKELLRDVSHELRSPLARALAALSLARQRTNGAVDSELDRLEAEIERLNGMIGKLLTFSRLDSGGGQMRRERVDVSELLTEIAADAEFEARADGKSVAVNDAGPLTVAGDPELLASCFENVIRNALRHTHADTTVEIRVSVDEGSGNGRIDIRDHGDGVPEDQLERIFTPFQRVEGEAGGNGDGTGIGLAIAKRSVELHGGSIAASNAPDGGLIVSISLPTTP